MRRNIFLLKEEKKKGFLCGNRGNQNCFVSSVKEVAKRFYVMHDQDHK